MSFLTLSPICWGGAASHGYKCTSDICLRTCRGHNSPSSEVSVCRGPVAPPSPSHQCRLSHTYLPVKSFIPLITGQWLYQQTASGVFSTCFFTQIIWIIVLVDFGASFLCKSPQACSSNVFPFIFLDDCFVLILSMEIAVICSLCTSSSYLYHF